MNIRKGGISTRARREDVETRVFDNVPHELAGLHDITPADVFKKDGANEILNAIKEEAENFTPDVTTDKGRKEIASKAHAVARSKTFLDNAGKDFVADKKDEIKIVDAERKFIRDFCDELKTDVRQPLTDFENAQAEEARKRAEEKAEADRLEAERIQKEADDKQAKIDADNEAIEKELEEKQAKLDAEVERLEKEKQDLADQKQRQDEEAERLATEKAEAEEKQEQNRLNTIEALMIAERDLTREKLSIRPDFYKVEWDHKINEDSIGRTGALTDEIKKYIYESILSVELEPQKVYIAEQLQAQIDRDEELKKQAVEEERERKAKEEEKEAGLKAVKDRREAEAKANQAHRDKVKKEAFEDMLEVYQLSAKTDDVLSAIIAGRIRHISINY